MPEQALRSVADRWPVCRVKYMATVNGKKLDESSPPDTRFMYVDISSVSADGSVVLSPEIRLGEAPTRARRIVCSGDTIISTVRTYLRAVAFFPSVDEAVVCSTGFAVLSPRQGLVPKFLYYWTRSSPFLEAIVSRSTGVSYPAANPSDVGDLPCPSPPESAQRGIVDFLDRETARIDDLVAKKRRLIELLEEKRTALITQAVTKGLDPTVPMKGSGVPWIGEIPAHWDVVRIGRKARLVSGVGFPDSYQGVSGGELPFYKVSDMTSEGNETELGEAANTVTPVVARELGGRIIPPGAVVFPKVGAALLTNKRRLTTRPCLVDNNVMACVPREGNPRYWRYMLGNLDFARIAQQGPVPSISAGQVKVLTVQMPPVAEQEAIAGHVADRTGIIAITQGLLTRQLGLLAEYRQALITAAVTGQIDVSKGAPDPEEAVV